MTYDDYYAQVYYFENGNRGTMIIPKDATEDDLLALKEILDIVIKRHYKQADTPQTDDIVIRSNLEPFRVADTPQTAEKVEEFQALCGVEIDPDDINRRVANAYAECGMNESQTDCCWR